MRTFFLLAGTILFTRVLAQPPQVPLYNVSNLMLPADLHKQVCISGMKYYDSSLYMVSERCPSIFVIDPLSGNIRNTINIQVPQTFEMEGMTSYKGHLYLVSENIAAVYQVNIPTGDVKQIETSISLPPKSIDGDGMEGIAANEKNNKFYLLRERNENMSMSQLYTFSIEQGKDSSLFSLKYESTIELPLENPQWRYSDISIDTANSRLLCLKSYSKGKLRQQFLESIAIDSNGKLMAETLLNIPVENFSHASYMYKNDNYSMNLEGITIDNTEAIFIVSDNTSGKAKCDLPAKEKTILLQLKKK